jgi:hypothetical protein
MAMAMATATEPAVEVEVVSQKTEVEGTASNRGEREVMRKCWIGPHIVIKGRRISIMNSPFFKRYLAYLSIREDHITASENLVCNLFCLKS